MVPTRYRTIDFAAIVSAGAVNWIHKLDVNMVDSIPSISNRLADEVTLAAPRTTDVGLTHVQCSSLLGKENMSRAQEDFRVIALQPGKATERSGFSRIAFDLYSGNELAPMIFAEAQMLFSLLFNRIIFPVMLLNPNS